MARKQRDPKALKALLSHIAVSLEPFYPPSSDRTPFPKLLRDIHKGCNLSQALEIADLWPIDERSFIPDGDESVSSIRYCSLLERGFINKDLSAPQLQRLLGHADGLEGLKRVLRDGSPRSKQMIASLIASGQRSTIEDLIGSSFNPKEFIRPWGFPSILARCSNSDTLTLLRLERVQDISEFEPLVLGAVYASNVTLLSLILDIVPLKSNSDCWETTCSHIFYFSSDDKAVDQGRLWLLQNLPGQFLISAEKVYQWGVERLSQEIITLAETISPFHLPPAYRPYSLKQVVFLSTLEKLSPEAFASLVHDTVKAWVSSAPRKAFSLLLWEKQRKKEDERKKNCDGGPQKEGKKFKFQKEVGKEKEKGKDAQKGTAETRLVADFFQNYFRFHRGCRFLSLVPLLSLIPEEEHSPLLQTLMDDSPLHLSHLLSLEQTLLLLQRDFFFALNTLLPQFHPSVKATLRKDVIRAIGESEREKQTKNNSSGDNNNKSKGNIDEDMRKGNNKSANSNNNQGTSEDRNKSGDLSVSLPEKSLESLKVFLDLCDFHHIPPLSQEEDGEIVKKEEEEEAKAK